MFFSFNMKFSNFDVNKNCWQKSMQIFARCFIILTVTVYLFFVSANKMDIKKLKNVISQHLE